MDYSYLLPSGVIQAQTNAIKRHPSLDKAQPSQQPHLQVPPRTQTLQRDQTPATVQQDQFIVLMCRWGETKGLLAAIGIAGGNVAFTLEVHRERFTRRDLQFGTRQRLAFRLHPAVALGHAQAAAVILVGKAGFRHRHHAGAGNTPVDAIAARHATRHAIGNDAQRAVSPEAGST